MVPSNEGELHFVINRYTEEYLLPASSGGSALVHAGYLYRASRFRHHT